jgi:O-6-methylguanine DNA methyltransferase
MIGNKTVYYDSKLFPILGRIYAASTEKGLCLLSLPPLPAESFFQKILSSFRPQCFTQDPGPFRELFKQLGYYFSGCRQDFDISLDLKGTPFQLRVWQALRTIPYGETRSYGEIARAMDRPKASRAVGQANHNNPVPIVVPCHRVIGSRGDLVGFGGGLPLKEKLLALEKGKILET